MASYLKNIQVRLGDCGGDEEIAKSFFECQNLNVSLCRNSTIEFDSCNSPVW